MQESILRVIEYHKNKYCSKMREEYSSNIPWWNNYSASDLDKYLDSRQSLLAVNCNDIKMTNRDIHKYVEAIEKTKGYRDAFYNKLNKAYYKNLQDISQINMSTSIEGTVFASVPSGEYFFIVVSRQSLGNRYISRNKSVNIYTDTQINLSTYDQDYRWEKFTTKSLIEEWKLKSASLDDY